jgi:acylphosphatase
MFAAVAAGDSIGGDDFATQRFTRYHVPPPDPVGEREMPHQRRTVWFEGSVQGVGFRYTACRMAGGFDVVGYVRNLPDGRVECVVEGQPRQIEAFLAELRRQMSDYVTGWTQQTGPGTGDLHSFTMRY